MLYYSQCSSNASQTQPTKQTKVQSSLFAYSADGGKSKSMVYAELDAVNHLSFNQISTSSFIQKSMRQKNKVAHSSNSHTTIRAKVKEFWEAAKEET